MVGPAGWVARAAVVLAVSAGVSSAPAWQAAGPQTAEPMRVARALDLYAEGAHQAAIEGRAFGRLDVAAAIAELDAWVGPLDPKTATPDQRAEHARRRQFAARYAVDATAHRGEGVRWWLGMPLADGQQPMGAGQIVIRGSLGPRRPWPPVFDDQGFNGPIVAWACEQLSKTGPVEPWEPWWWLTSIALLQEAGEWGMLRGNVAVTYGGASPPGWERAVRQQVSKGHLVEARARLGDHPRLRLAEAVTRAAALTDASRRHTVGAGASGPMVLGRYDVLRHLEDAARALNSGPFASLERDFEALLAEPGFEGEVSLRIAQLRLLRRDWSVALRWIDRAAGATDDRLHLATADYFRGWIFERTNRPAEALAAYRAAHARYDRSPNLNTLLAAQLMQAGERTRAAEVLERSMREQHDMGWRDLWQLLVEGDVLLASRYARLMREAR